MNKKEKDNLSLLIEIILYLLLAIAFFSDFAFRSSKDIDFIIMITFLFGLLSLASLYIGKSLDKDYFKKIGYVLAGSFVLTFFWFIFNTITVGGGNTIIDRFLNLSRSNTIWIALLIPSIILIISMISKNKRDKTP